MSRTTSIPTKNAEKDDDSNKDSPLKPVLEMIDSSYD